MDPSIVSLQNQVWWNYLEEDLQELLKQSVLLIGIVEKDTNGLTDFHDYSFVVFSASKCYEGFLKKLFLDLGFITSEDYTGRRFRVGKSLNPQLDKRRRESYGVYDKIVAYCNGRELADAMWNTWLECRNRLFHWFPNEKKAITFFESKEKVTKIIATIDKAFVECRMRS